MIGASTIYSVINKLLLCNEDVDGRSISIHPKNQQSSSDVRSFELENWAHSTVVYCMEKLAIKEKSLLVVQ